MGENFITFSRVRAVVRLGNGENLVTVRDVSFSLERGRSYALVGKSGSGKTSLISILGILNRDFSGSYRYGDREVEKLSDRACSRLRASDIGFVFQNYSLIPHLKVWENIDLALQYSREKLSGKERKEKVLEVLDSVGLKKRKDDLPKGLSGGEQQRVAIARALVTSPSLLVCDEPTGALDNATSEVVLDLLSGLVKESATTLFLVTHDEDVAGSCDTLMKMHEGEIISVDDVA